jgi:hypothetical protein
MAMVCRGKTSAGSNCKANAMSGSNYCFSHNPATREQHRAATRKGGAVSPFKAVETAILPKVELASVQSVVDVLADAINRVRVVRPDGSMDVKSANTLGFLCGKYAELYKIANLEEKIKNWEEGKDWGWADAYKAAVEAMDEEEYKQHQKEIYDDARVR